MSRWFRSYVGMMRDEKLVRVAMKSKQPVERVVWVWGAILESAAEINENGKYDIDPSEIAYFLRADEDDIRSILDGLENNGRVNSSVVVNWSDRQFESDSSKERVAAYRERKRLYKSHDQNREKISKSNQHDKMSNGDVTLHVTPRNVTVTPPDTDTDTDTDTGVQQPTVLATAAREPVDCLVDPSPDPVFSGQTESQQKTSFTAPENLHDLVMRCCEIAGISTVSPKKITDSIDMVSAWIKSGCDPGLDILPTVNRLRSETSEPINSLKFFEKAVYASNKQRSASQASSNQPVGKPSRGSKLEAIADAGARALDILAQKHGHDAVFGVSNPAA